METAYLLVWIEAGVARFIGIYSERQPTMISGSGFWAELGQQRAHSYHAAAEAMRKSAPFYVPMYPGPIGNALKQLPENPHPRIEWSDIIERLEPERRKAMIESLVTSDHVADVVVACDRALNGSAKAKALVDNCSLELV